MMLPLAVFMLASQLVVAVADKVPDLGVDQSCRAQAARGDALGGGKDGLGVTLEGCLRAEHAARDKLGSDWGKFTAGERERCTAASTMGGEPSYVELLTCLETTQQARQLQRDNDHGAPGDPGKKM